ncbi:hypothetical protein WBG78_24405 [Chryseolinea sp. T2]|uniref:hypothetical protein n=1 Tax=Chryseolinea sp. T2 TaxID=3129255 RepID=UPI0030770D56
MKPSYSKVLFATWLALFCLVLTLSAVTPARAQMSQPRRYEKIQKNADDGFNIISLGHDGIALFRDLNKYRNSNKLWQLIYLDTALQEKKDIEFELNDRNKFLGYEVASDRLFLLFRTGETTKNDFELIEITFSGNEAGRYQFKPDLDFKLTHFTKAGPNFIFGGYVNNEPAVVLFELSSNHIRVLPGFFQKDTELVDLRANENQTFNTVLIDRGTKENRKLLFRTFDETGKQLLDDLVPIESNIFLQTGITSTLQREDLAVLGTWGERNSKQSIGFYFMNVDPFSEQQLKYVDFGQLQHFVDYLNPKRAERVKESSKADLAAKRIPNFTSYVTPHRLKEYKDGYLLLAEIYTPVSTTSPYYSNPYYYNPYYGGGSAFSPFYFPGTGRMYRPYSFNSAGRTMSEIKTSQASVLSFDPQGKIRWDQSVKIEDVRMAGVDQVADFHIEGNKLTLLYKKESELKLKSVILDSDKTEELTSPIYTGAAEDNIRSEREYEGGVRHWIDNTFYVWGYHTVRNTNSDDRVRDVFYINKVVVR